jgi:hypothetical protein
MGNARFTTTLLASRQLTPWRPVYIHYRCLNTASNPALFRLLEDGTGLFVLLCFKNK